MIRAELAPALALAVAACGAQAPTKPGPATTEHEAPAGSAAAGDTDDTDDTGATDSVSPAGSPALVRTQSRKVRVEAPHGGAITDLAVTRDGGAAVTCDELGGVRLWPRLDGTVEPRAVELPRPEALALGRDPRGFVIAMTDPVGGLVIQLVDDDGLTVQRAVLPGEPAFSGVAIGERGTLAWRVDQRVVRVANDGAIVDQLAAEPGQQIVGIALAGDRAVASIAVTQPVRARRARWISLAGRLAWGAWIGGAELGESFALSPSGARLATIADAHIRVYDTQRGDAIVREPAQLALAIAMPTEDDVALAMPGGGAISWLDLAKAAGNRGPKPAPGASPVTPVPQPAIDAPALAAGGGRAITAISGELMLVSPTSLHYLGYELESPAVAAGGPNGALVIALGDTVVQLDRSLAATAPPDLQVPAGSAIADLRWLGGSEWLVESSRINDGVTAVALIDAARGTLAFVRRGMAMVHLLQYEPATRLATLSLGDAPELLRHAPGKLRFDRVATLPKPAGFERTQLVAVSPVFAAGIQVVAVQMRERLTVRWLRELSALDRGGTSITIDGSLAGVDAAGRAYVWQADPLGGDRANRQPLELAMYRDGKRLGVLPTDGPMAVWPDPRGQRIVEVGQRAIRMITIDGTVVWALPVERVTEALWLDDGTLGIVSAAGIARLDPATGAVIAARCGWRFGLSPRQHPVSPRVEPVCTQLR